MAALASTVGLLGGYGLVTAGPASAATLSQSTWSGASTTDGNWSTAGNWAEGAPSNGDTIGTLIFPDVASTCGTGACTFATNDLTGLTVGDLNIAASTAPYDITGNALTLTGGINVTGDGSTQVTPTWETPLTLAPASGTTAIAVPTAGFDLYGDVTGPSDVTASLNGGSSGSATFDLASHHVETTSFTASGPDTSQSGNNAGNNGFLTLNGADINGTGATAGNPVNVSHVVLQGDYNGGDLGALGNLKVTGGLVDLLRSDALGNPMPADLSTTAASFDATSATTFYVADAGSTPGTSFSQLTSGGAVDLGSAALTVSRSGTACTDPAPGTSYDIVRGASITGQFSDGNGGTVADGDIVNMPTCDNSSTVPLRINYNPAAGTNPATVSLTVVTPTTTTVSAQPSSPAVGQADAVTAAVSAPSGTPTGTVTFFEDQGSQQVANCVDLPLSASSPYSATCDTSFEQSGPVNVSASYTPSASADFTPSGSGVNLDVTPINGAASSTAASSTSSGGSATASNPDSGVTAQASGGPGTVTVSHYAADPVATAAFSGSPTNYFDVKLTSPANFSSVEVTEANVTPGTALKWWNGSSWQNVTGHPSGPTVSNGVLTVYLDNQSSPTLGQLGGTVFASAVPSASPTPSPSPSPAGPGYRMVASDGGVFSFDQTFYGSLGGDRLAAPIVGTADAKGGKGYFLVASDGGVFAMGPGAKFQGSTGGTRLNKPIVAMAVDPATGGYWLVASDGGVFSFNAPFFGSLGGVNLNQPIVGITAAPNGKGYYLVAKDGGVFAMGPGAKFRGSTGGVRLNQPIVGMAIDPATGGYWLVASDGGIFAFDAKFQGSTGGVRLNQPIVGMAVDPATGGYWLVAADGGVFSFHAPFHGSLGSITLTKPIVGMSAG